jgi:hypothetical protein
VKIREYEDGLSIAYSGYTVADAVNDWLTFALGGNSKGTIDNYTILARGHITPASAPESSAS